jgi:GNAT superfamily N-acetyltransferase
MSESAPSVRVELCSPADRAEQARLFNACFKKRIDADGLAWRYDCNPHGAAVSFLSRPASSEGVSGYACSPRIALAHGDEATRATIGETGDVMTHPEWRKRGLFSALDRAAMEETKRLGWPFAFGLPNRRSAHIFLELGWQQVGTLRTWTFVFRADAASRAARAREGRIRGWMTRFGVRRGERARDALRGALEKFRVEDLTRVPPEVIELSRAKSREHALMIQRDAAYLEWRFLASPSRLHRMIGLYDERGAFAAYAVVQIPRAGESHGYLVDVLGRDESATLAAIEAGLARLAREGASYAESTAIDGSAWSRTLARCGFLAPRADHHLTVILHVHAPDHPLARAARDPKQWHFTDGDRDDETMG